MRWHWRAGSPGSGSLASPLARVGIYSGSIRMSIHREMERSYRCVLLVGTLSS
jgi:hypothetical protein